MFTFHVTFAVIHIFCCNPYFLHSLETKQTITCAAEQSLTFESLKRDYFFGSPLWRTVSTTNIYTHIRLVFALEVHYMNNCNTYEQLYEQLHDSTSNSAQRESINTSMARPDPLFSLI